jgi:tetratricopeptide (TPR) repeat protein
MKIFLSHHSSKKDLLREIKGYWPDHLNIWIDENKLIWGEDLEVSLREAINEKCDYFVLFLCEKAIGSDWVKKELKWALNREKRLKRRFILPVLLEENILEKAGYKELKNRLYVMRHGTSGPYTEAFAKEISNKIHALTYEYLKRSEKERSDLMEQLSNLKDQLEKEQKREHTKEGLQLLENFKFNEAAEAFSKAIEERPADSIASNGRGMAYNEIKNNKAELDTLKKQVNDLKYQFEKEQKREHTEEGLQLLENLMFNEAIEAFSKAIKERPGDSIAYNGRGMAYDKIAKHKKAIANYKKALNIDIAVHGERHSNVATRYNNIGVVLHKLGEYDHAIEDFQEALKIYMAVYGRNHPSVAKVYNNIGRAWNELGEYNRAIEYCRKALRIDHAVFGKKHPDVAVSYNNIGSGWRNIGDHKKALNCFIKALRIDHAVFGKKHPDVAVSYNNIGLGWSNIGDSKKALFCFNKAIRINLAVFSEEHPNVAVSYNNIGLVWYRHGEHNRAIEFFDKAFKIYLAVFGEKHPNVASSYNNIGRAWKELGEYNKANEFFDKALKIRRHFFDENHPDVISVKEDIEMLKVKMTPPFLQPPRRMVGERPGQPPPRTH